MATTKLAVNRREPKDSSTGRLAAATFHVPPALASEEVFWQMLRMERRRSERSGRAFILVLVSGENLLLHSGSDKANNVVSAINSNIRETDLIGWYKPHTTLGLVMTDISEPSQETVERIAGKISSALQDSLSIETDCHLTMVVRVYPRDGEDRVFYPEVFKCRETEKLKHVIKRAIDILGSLGALILFSPLLAVIAIIIKCTSAGPVFHCNKRLGQYGKEFWFYKFRTMSANNDSHIHREYVARLIAGAPEAEQNDGLFKLTSDPRITPFGRFLRRTSLDELPQFVNVLLNNMSLVGPRPPLPYEFERYRPWHNRRVLEQKPGITGLWQVEGRSRTSFDDMVRMDIRYAAAQSLWLDLKILIQTPAAMFSGRGAC